MEDAQLIKKIILGDYSFIYLFFINNLFLIHLKLEIPTPNEWKIMAKIQEYKV